MNELNELLSNNLLFSIPVSIVMIIAILEGVLTLIGFGMSATLDSIFPEVDIPEVDISDIDNGTSFSEIFGWINKGRVPVLIIFIIFFTSFGLIGLIIQNYYFSLHSEYFNQFFVFIISFCLSLPITRYLSSIIGRIMPKDETSAISNELFVGNIAEIVIGKATHNKFTEAKFKDTFGQTHYIRVKALIEGDSFEKGDKVFIHSKINDKDFFVIEDINN